MSHKAFLMTIGQLASNKKARIVIKNHFTTIEESSEGWCFSTPVYCVEGSLPPEIRLCLSPSGNFHIQDLRFQLKLQAGVLVLSYQTPMKEGKYLPFRFHLQTFVEAATEWKEILSDLRAIPRSVEK